MARTQTFSRTEQLFHREMRGWRPFINFLMRSPCLEGWVELGPQVMLSRMFNALCVVVSDDPRAVLAPKWHTWKMNFNFIKLYIYIWEQNPCWQTAHMLTKVTCKVVTYVVLLVQIVKDWYWSNANICFCSSENAYSILFFNFEKCVYDEWFFSEQDF